MILPKTQVAQALISCRGVMFIILSLCLGGYGAFLFKKVLHNDWEVNQVSKEVIAKKAEIVDAVAEKFNAASSIVVTDYRGLTVEEVTELRKQLREEGVEMRVIKNTFLKRAADKSGYEGLDEVFSGPTAVAFGGEDVAAPARVIVKFAEDHDALEIKGGMIEGKVSSVEEIVALSKLPDRDGMLSMLLSVLQAPVRNVAYAVKAIADNKDEDAA